MAESISTDCESVIKDSFVSPANFSENSSISYNSPAFDDETIARNDYDINASSPFGDQCLGYLSGTKNNGELIENDFPNNNITENNESGQCSIDGACVSNSGDLLESDENSTVLTVGEDEPLKKTLRRTSRSDSTVKSDLCQAVFSKPDTSPKDGRSRLERNTRQSPRSETSPRLERSPKAERRSERKAAETETVKLKEDKIKEKNVKSSSPSEVKNGSVRKNKSENIMKLSKSGAISSGKKRINNNSNTGRGRPPKRKALVTTYHSQISGDKNGIKICIKKANLVPQAPTSKKSKKRKKQKSQYSESEGSDYESALYSPSKKQKVSVKSRNEKITDKDADNQIQEPEDQTRWGAEMPTIILENIFQNVCNDVGCLPALVRLSKVCRLWRSVALTPSLWNNIDLCTWHKERQKTDLKLRWLLENRLSRCQELSLSNWKINNISIICEIMTSTCTELQGLNLSGWNGLNSDHLKHISTSCKKLQRLDLSSINSDTTITKCAIGAQPLMTLADDMGGRLTHLVLANNKLAGFPQIIAAISSHCPNLQLLDLSNIKTVSHTTAALHIEKLQKGCEKLRVLRITNSQIVLASASVKEQVESPGFPMLEELSVATGSDVTLIDDTSIERILKNSHKLRLLDVRGCMRISDSSLVRVPAWDLEHLFLSGCYVTRFTGSGLELIAQKWSHSLLEMDLGWSTATEPLDAAVLALAEKEEESRLRILNLCGSSVSLDPVKAVLKKCRHLTSINLSSCRALPRGIKRLYEGSEVAELLSSLEEKPKISTPEPTDSDNNQSPRTQAQSNYPVEQIDPDQHLASIENISSIHESN